VNGEAVCWGNSEMRTGIPASGRFAALASGAAHTCGLSTDGEVTCWGPAATFPMNIPAGLRLAPQCTLANAMWPAAEATQAEGMIPCGGAYGGDPEAWRCPAGTMAMGDPQILCVGCRVPLGGGCSTCIVPTSCEICPEGTAGKDGICRPCGDADTFANAMGNAELHTNATGLKQCPRCLAGQQPDLKKAFCVPCPRGTAGSQGICETCDENSLGSFSEQLGLTECHNCPRGKSADPARGICMPCPIGYLWQWSKCVKCMVDENDFWELGCEGDGTCPHGSSWREAGCVPCSSEFLGQEVVWRGEDCIACAEGLKARFDGRCVDQDDASKATAISSNKFVASTIFMISMQLG